MGRADAGSVPLCSKGFLFQSIFSADTLVVFVYPSMQSRASTPVRTLKIPNTGTAANTNMYAEAFHRALRVVYFNLVLSVIALY